MDRIVKVITKGDSIDRVGIPVSEGPATFRLMLTWPYNDKGRIVEVPLEEIERIEEAIQGPMEEPPETIGKVEIPDLED